MDESHVSVRSDREGAEESDEGGAIEGDTWVSSTQEQC